MESVAIGFNFVAAAKAIFRTRPDTRAIPDLWSPLREIPGPFNSWEVSISGFRTLASRTAKVNVADNQHIPVLLRELGDAIVSNIQGTYVDCTFGRGGHSAYVLKKLGQTGRVLAIDCDPDAENCAKEQEDKDSRFEFIRARFGDLAGILKERGFERIDGAFFDIGVSTPQLRNARRGFAFDMDGPLDMRMDPAKPLSAHAWLNHATIDELALVLRNYGELRNSHRIARAIGSARPLETTSDLVRVLKGIDPSKRPIAKTLAQVFQAIRIHVNDELNQLESGLQQAFAMLKVGGRLGVITFHRLEHRLARSYLRSLTETTAPRGMPIRDKEEPEARFVLKNVKPSPVEIERNPSSRSAMLQVVERIR